MFYPTHALSMIVLTPLLAAIVMMLIPRRNLLAVRMLGGARRASRSCSPSGCASSTSAPACTGCSSRST